VDALAILDVGARLHVDHVAQTHLMRGDQETYFKQKGEDEIKRGGGGYKCNDSMSRA